MSRASSPTIDTMPRKSSPSSKRIASTQTKAKPAHNRSQPGHTLGLSDLHLRHAGLEKEHQKLLKQIKSKQSEIDKLQVQMREILQEVAAKTIPLMQELWEINERVHGLFKDILTKRKLGKKSRQDIERIYHGLQRSGIISPQFDDPDEDEDGADSEFETEFKFEGVGGDDHQDQEEDSNRYRSFKDLFDNVSKIDRDEQKKIRHVFLRLAEIFHPDKCLDHDRAEHYAEIMKEVNQAYAEGNLAKLLEIEKQHELGQEIDIDNEDSLLRNCDRLDQHNTLLKNQYENLKLELRLIKNTHEGSIAVEYRKMMKRGINPINEIVGETQEKLDVMVEIEDFVQSFHQKRITIKEFVRGPEVLQKMQMLTLEELLFGTEFSMFDDEDD
jgi:hypothetical protein